ncbi:adenylate/guanylate cyclase domain-containing protein [Arundinibacter roseus]|nr:adenylate/guanylate cyclase domain-containing protein [Arundinibacter roseus]
MLTILHKKIIYETELTIVYKGVVETTDDEVIVKTPKGSDYSGIYNEYALLKEEKFPLGVIEIVHFDDIPSLVRSYLPGLSLKSLIEQGEFGLDLFFDYALEIIGQLQDIHARTIIHKDISSVNIIIHTTHKTARIIDFESSIKAHYTTVPVFEATRRIGNLSYISPEQTGRMNRILDYRADYYSLGIVFFEMLTGQLPFQSGDMLELIHGHIARKPPGINEINPEIPSILGDLVGKLIAKNAEERYQSMQGLRADLLRCRQEWIDFQRIESFTLGQFDVPARLFISQKMVGRTWEKERILDLYAQAAAGGKVFLTVGGLSGVGKSTLIGETAKPLTEHKGLILKGKFDPLQKNIPYFAWIQAIDQFADSVLTESPETLQNWKHIFRNSLQDLEGILVQLVPKMGKIVGPVPAVSTLNALEIKNRLQYVLGLFLSLLANAQHPLLLFLDDWQWADDDSIRLLESIRLNPALSHIMLVVAYRSNEIDAVHSFYPILKKSQEEAESSVFLTEHLHVEAISEADTEELIRNTLPETQQNPDTLSAILYSKTQGNPFFIGQFLNLLYDRNLLWLDSTTHLWTWDLPAIQALAISDNVVEIILQKISGLTPTTRHGLTVASAIGNTFGVAQTAELLDLNPADLHRLLWPAIQNTCILPTRADYKFIPEFYESQQTDVQFRFAHDRIQQTLYGEIDSSQREELHFKIGMRLAQGPDAENRILEAANHFLTSESLLSAASERTFIGQLLQKAGYLAYRSAAFGNAFHYWALWEKLLLEPAREDLPTYRHLIETSHLSGRKELSQKYEQKALALCLTQEERSQTFEIMITSYTATDQLAEAIALSRKALGELGIKIPEKAQKWQVIYQAIRSRLHLPDAKIAKIAQGPDMTDSRYTWAMRLLNASLSSYFLIKFETYPLLIFKMVDLNTKYGNTREAITGFGSYGLILAGILNAPESGYMAGKQALLLLEKYKAEDLVAQAGFIDSTFIAHWKEPITEMATRCFENYRKGLSKGDIWYSGWNLYMSNVFRIYVGDKMSVLLSSLCGQETFFLQHNIANLVQRTRYERHFASILRYARYSDPTFDWQLILSGFTTTVDLTALFTSHALHTICSLWMGDFAKAWEMSLLTDAYTDSVKSVFSYHYFQAYQAISGLAIYEQSDPATQKKIRKVVQKNTKFLTQLSTLQPGNYAWALRLVEAESKRAFSGDFEPQAYHDAIEAARRGGMVFPAVFSRLTLLRALLKTNSTDSYDEYEKLKAELLYWEMEGVLAALQDTHSMALSSRSRVRPQVSSGRASHSSYSLPFEFDALTFVKSIEALSGELQLDKLLTRLMTFALENAGADYGCFLIRRGNDFEPVIERYADGTIATSEETMLSAVPAVVYNFVVQTGEVLLLENVSEDPRFGQDPVVKKYKDKSLLCVPFITKGKINGIIYLTNRLTPNVFTEQRVGLLTLLAGQISLSIENAMLYENMENLVAERTSQLEEEKKKSDRLLLNVLPEQVADELKRSGKASPRYFGQVTVMFCDFKDFTLFAEIESPETLIEELDYCFKAFDAIIGKYAIEKIKTIGDAYLCVSGLPLPNPDHALTTVQAAMELQQWIREETQKRQIAGKSFLDLRIGIHTGPVVAGVVGATKFAYDIWGDAVNIAARMEESGVGGRINISDTTYALIKDHFSCEYRGKIVAKNKGEIDMYFANPPI